MTRGWLTVIGLTVSLVLIYWALHDVSLAEVWGHMAAANLWLLVLSIAIQTTAILIRAARWRVFLRPALAAPSYGARFASTCIGFMANNVLPARVGEFARAFALSRSQPISVSASFGSLVVERVFDALTLAAFVALPIVLPGFLGVPELGDRLVGKLAVVLLVFGGGVLTLYLLIWRTDLAVRLFRLTVGGLLPTRAADKIAEVVESFVHGLGAMRRPELVAAGLAWSLVHWCWAGLAYYVGLAAFGVTEPGYLGALFVQGVNAFAVAVPSSPGFFGPFEASVRLALSPFGVPAAKSVSFAVAFHIGSFIPVTLLGVFYLSRMGLTWGEVGHSEEIVEGGEGGESGEGGGAGDPSSALTS